MGTRNASQNQCPPPSMVSPLRESVIRNAAAVCAGRVRAREVAQRALDRIARADASINAFTRVTRERALAEADAVDAALAAGRPVGPLAGVPYAVKNLFDVAGEVTLAGPLSGFLERAPRSMKLLLRS